MRKCLTVAGERIIYELRGLACLPLDLVPLDYSPRALIGALDRERSGPLVAAIDACNARWGRGAVLLARAGLVARREWSTKFEMRTPRYTTEVAELPVAMA